MKTKNKIIRKSTGLFFAVFCLLCFVEKYSMVTAMAEGAEEHFGVEEEASFGGAEVQTSNSAHTAPFPSEPSPQEPSQTAQSQVPPSQVPPSQVPPSQASSSQTPSPSTSKDSTTNKSDTDMASDYTASDVSDASDDHNIDMQENVSDNNAEFTTPAKGDYSWNVTRQNGNAIEIAEVSQNGLKENPTKEKLDKNTTVTEESHEERILLMIPAILLLIWGFLRIIKRLRIVYGKL